MAPFVQDRKVCLTPTTRVLCSNTAKTRNPLKLAGVPQTNETISAANGPKSWTYETFVLQMIAIVASPVSIKATRRQNTTVHGQFHMVLS